MSEINDIASGIYQSEFDSDSSNVNPSYIYNWLSANLGLLNTLINTNFSGQDPEMNLEERSIYEQLYMHNYYSKQARNVLRGVVSVSNSGDNILSVSDGDNSISFINKNEVGKVYRDLAKDVKVRLDEMVAKYNIYSSKPLQVGGVESLAEYTTTLNTIRIPPE